MKCLTKEALGESGKPPVIVEETAESPVRRLRRPSSDEGARRAARRLLWWSGLLVSWRGPPLIRDGRELEALAAALGNSPPPPPPSRPRRQNTDPRAVDAAAGPRLARRPRWGPRAGDVLEDE